MNSVSASSFVFLCGRSAVDAFKSLRSLIASRSPGEEELVTLPWVQNHWSLVIWKVASYVRSKPDMFEEWWNFEKVMDQLRYRCVFFCFRLFWLHEADFISLER